jgi:tetratricopeptide (TPR) repeat protein
MYLNKERFQLRRQRRDRLFYVALYVVLIFGGLYLNSLIVPGGPIQPLSVPTPTATRSPQSYSEEAEKQFSAGQLAQAIEAYERAIEQDPKRIDYWIRKARIEVYAGQAEDAVVSAERAIFLDPNNSTAHAVHALALDWTQDVASASDAAARAITLDTNNALAHAYYAEILVDQQRYAQARDEAQMALSLDPNSMDAYRTYGYYLEATSNYEQAIEQYQLALKINPNLAFIYMKIGVLYRSLAGTAETDADQTRYFDLSIQYFQRASSINPNDTGPFISIARSYIQTGQYATAAQYLEEALTIDPANAAVHAELGKVHFRNLNYENSIVELKCAVEGCSTTEDTIDDEEGAPVYQVEPLALDAGTLDTFYIYSSVLAALSTPEDPYCRTARPLMDRIDAWLVANDPENPFVFDILAENENICLLADGATLPPNSSTDETGTPDPEATPEMTPAP